jgi:esterase FrsA
VAATPPLSRRLLITACAATGTTDRAAARLGVRAFLPALFPLRYANMGGLDRAAFVRELDGVRTFAEATWCGYWEAIADAHLSRAQGHMDALAEPRASAPSLHALSDAPDDAAAGRVGELLAAGAPVLADHGPQSDPARIDALAADLANDRGDEDVAAVVHAAQSLDAVVKAMTYLQVGAFPGASAGQLRCYWRSRRLFDAIIPALASGLGLVIAPLEITVGGERVTGYSVLPDDDVVRPAVLMTNGLEGTVQELLVPSMRHRDSGLGVFAMEMPGTYAYDAPLSTASEAIYHAVLDQIATDPRVDADRIGMVGVSFGGYWAARMAARSPRLRASIACGAPTQRSFRGGIGMPEVILEALGKVMGASNPIALMRSMRALAMGDLYTQIPIPILAANGDNDTLMATQDTVDLAAGAPLGELQLYPDDDHCAMGHYHEWLDDSQSWLVEHLAAGPVPGR